nr:MAG TPA: hypothetical protein [Caudoviricetes sp.]
MGKNKDTFFDKQQTGGRPLLVLNQAGIDLVQALGRLQCTNDEIASCLGTTDTTLLNAQNKEVFLGALEKGKAEGRMSLRRIQMKLAETSATMAIFLGKQILGQRENVEPQRLVLENDNVKAVLTELKKDAEAE